MEPAKSIITAFGGAPAVAEIVGLHVTRIYKWQQPKSKGGTGGLIPIHHAVTLRDFATKHGVDVDEGDFFPATKGNHSTTPDTAPSTEARNAR